MQIDALIAIGKQTRGMSERDRYLLKVLLEIQQDAFPDRIIAYLEKLKKADLPFYVSENSYEELFVLKHFLAQERGKTIRGDTEKILALLFIWQKIKEAE